MSSADAQTTTTDVFLGGRLQLMQPAKGFRAGLDAVLLAAAIESGSGDCNRALDIGAGVGTAGLCLAARVADARVTLMEVAPTLAALARRNVELNGLADRVNVVEADVHASPASLQAADLAQDSYDVVMANPPYLTEGLHRLPVDETAAGAFAMARGGLEGWARLMARTAAPGGRIALIHRADALGEILQVLETRFGAIRVLPIHPRAGEPAHRLIVLARKGSRAPLQLLTGLVLHGHGNAFLPAVEAVLRDGAPLAIGGNRQ